MLDWNNKDDGAAGDPMRDPAAAAKLLAELRAADPLAALTDLGAWLDAVNGIPSHEEKIRSDFLSLIQEASGAHVRVPPKLWRLTYAFFTNSGSRRDISVIVRPHIGAGKREKRQLVRRSAAEVG